MRKYIICLALAVVLSLVFTSLVLAQGPVVFHPRGQPYVTWTSGTAPLYCYSGGICVRAYCFNLYGAHVPCQRIRH